MSKELKVDLQNGKRKDRRAPPVVAMFRLLWCFSKQAKLKERGTYMAEFPHKIPTFKQWQPTKRLCIINIVVGVVLLAVFIGIIVDIKTKRDLFYDEAIETQAVVTKLRRGRGSNNDTIEVRFFDTNRNEVRTSVRPYVQAPRGVRQGDTMTVWYDPSNPIRDTRGARRTDPFMAYFIGSLGALGLTFMAAGLTGLYKISHPQQVSDSDDSSNTDMWGTKIE